MDLFVKDTDPWSDFIKISNYLHTKLYHRENPLVTSWGTPIPSAKLLRRRRRMIVSFFSIQRNANRLKEHSWRINHCYLDCCCSTTAGSSDFKVSYLFPTALAGRVIKQYCTYSGKGAISKAIASCRINMQVSQPFDSININSCTAKHKTNQVLDNLNEVRTFLFIHWGLNLWQLLVGKKELTDKCTPGEWLNLSFRISYFM